MAELVAFEDCGCVVYKEPLNCWIEYCPKHASAPKLYEALKYANEEICRLCKNMMEAPMDCASCEEKDNRDKIISLAEGKEE